jgi:hypothetical protein
MPAYTAGAKNPVGLKFHLLKTLPAITMDALAKTKLKQSDEMHLHER